MCIIVYLSILFPSVYQELIGGHQPYLITMNPTGESPPYVGSQSTLIDSSSGSHQSPLATRRIDEAGRAVQTRHAMPVVVTSYPDGRNDSHVVSSSVSNSACDIDTSNSSEHIPVIDIIPQFVSHVVVADTPSIIEPQTPILVPLSAVSPRFPVK